jgi:AmiR/NasT family two-component response regulator
MSADVENIIELLGPRELIGQAIQVLMTEDEMSRDGAFELLVRGSSSSHRRMREIAAEIVQRRESGVT